MVEWQTVESVVPGANPTLRNFFAPCCRVSQAIGCIKSLPNGRRTEFKCTKHDNADDQRPYDTMMIA